MLTVRPEQASDTLLIHALNEKVFGQSAEAELVDLLRDAEALACSIVADLDGEIIGHLAFSPVSIESGHTTFRALGLAPMAVHPDHQKKGIGTAMFHYWKENFAHTDDNLVVVLGHPEYYPRFGFVPARPHGIIWEHEVPEEAFMVLELKEGALEKIHGTVRFHDAFNTM